MLILLWLALILVLSVLPSGSSLPVSHGDKIVHFVAYGASAVFFFDYFRQFHQRFTALLATIICASGYGALIEIMQFYLPYRSFELGDLAADAGGAALAGVIYSLWKGA